jgi:hypothetical protein
MIMSEILDACLDSAFEGQQCVCVCVCNHCEGKVHVSTLAGNGKSK